MCVASLLQIIFAGANCVRFHPKGEKRGIGPRRYRQFPSANPTAVRSLFPRKGPASESISRYLFRVFRIPIATKLQDLNSTLKYQIFLLNHSSFFSLLSSLFSTIFSKLFRHPGGFCYVYSRGTKSSRNCSDPHHISRPAGSGEVLWRGRWAVDVGLSSSNWVSGS